MKVESTLNQQISRWGFWAVIVFVITAALHVFTPRYC